MEPVAKEQPLRQKGAVVMSHWPVLDEREEHGCSTGMRDFPQRDKLILDQIRPSSGHNGLDLQYAILVWSSASVRLGL